MTASAHHFLPRAGGSRIRKSLRSLDYELIIEKVAYAVVALHPSVQISSKRAAQLINSQCAYGSGFPIMKLPTLMSGTQPSQVPTGL